MSFKFDQALEDRFVQLVQSSWAIHGRFERASCYDDAFMGGLISAHVKNGFSMLDCTSDGSSHYARFVNAEKERVILRLHSRSGEDIVFAQTLGNLAGLQLAYERSYNDISKIMKAVKSEIKSELGGPKNNDFPDPGVFRIDAEGTSAICETALLIDIRDYLNMETLLPDIPKIWQHCSAVYQSLEKYLTGVMK